MENDAKSESPQSNKNTSDDLASSHDVSRSITELRKLFAREELNRSKVEDTDEQWSHDLSDDWNKDELTRLNDFEKKLARKVTDRLSLSSLTQVDLIKNALSGDQRAWNLLFVCFAASLRHMAAQRVDRDHEDVRQEGAIGLINAVKIFDVSKSANPAAYLLSEVKWAMWRYIYKHHELIRLPDNARADLRKLESGVKLLYARLGREPSEEELALQMGVPLKHIREIRLIKSRRTVKSTEALIESGESENSFKSIELTDSDSEPDELNEYTILNAQLIKVINSLSEKERLILQLRFGLSGHEECTLENIGVRFNITKQRVLQIEKQLLEKLRHRIGVIKTNSRQPPLASPTPASDATFSSAMSSWLCLVVLKRLRTSSGCELRDRLAENVTEQLATKIRLNESIGPHSISQEANALVYWTIEHLIADGFIRTAFGGGELVLTEKGSSWLFYSKQSPIT